MLLHVSIIWALLCFQQLIGFRIFQFYLHFQNSSKLYMYFLQFHYQAVTHRGSFLLSLFKKYILMLIILLQLLKFPVSPAKALKKQNKGTRVPKVLISSMLSYSVKSITATLLKLFQLCLILFIVRRSFTQPSQILLLLKSHQKNF